MKQLAAIFGSLTGAVVTANGYRPLSRSGYLSTYTFVFGVFATELPLNLIAGQAAVLAGVSRWLSPRTRWIAWLVSVLSWLGLFGLHRAGQDADVPLKAALDAGLGTDRRTETAGIWKRPTTDAPAAMKSGMVPMMRVYRNYTHDRDIAYGEFGARNQLDIWRRPDLDRNGRAPVLLQVPGGAWMTGSKRGQAHPLMSHLVERGWVCAAINYRLSPRSTWPDHIVDVKRAIAWTREHIAEYGGDPDWIAITGGSAGGHLSALAALTPGDPQFQPGFEDADTRVQAAVPFYGVYDFTENAPHQHPQLVGVMQKYVFKQRRREFAEVFEAASPISHVSADAPPFFVLHGVNDTLIPVGQGRTFAERLREISDNPVVYAELPYAQHAFDTFGSPRAGHTVSAVEQFLAEVYTRHHAERQTA